MDTAFLYAKLDYKIYFKQPEGHEDQEHHGWVWECSIMGSLMYAAVATRPDITETVSRLCKRMNSPMQADMKKAQ